MDSREIILADNQDITRLGLRAIVRGTVEGLGDITVREVSQRHELVAELKVKPTAMVVLDYTLFDLASTDDLLNLAGRFPEAMWVLFSSELTEGLIRRLSMEQNFSMVLKEDSASEIVTALKCALGGVRYLCHQVTNLLLMPQAAAEKSDLLTATETEILRMLAMGHSAKEIAAERCSSIHTIHTHKKNIFRKIGVNTAYEAARYAMRTGIVEMVEYYI